jgi:hypothetical protein
MMPPPFIGCTTYRSSPTDDGFSDYEELDITDGPSNVNLFLSLFHTALYIFPFQAISLIFFLISSPDHHNFINIKQTAVKKLLMAGFFMDM